MIRPNHLIQKPVYAVLIVLGQMPQVKAGFNYLSKDDLDEVWRKCKNVLKKRDFLKQLETFDIRRVTEHNVLQIQDLFNNDPWMAANLILRESNFCANLFQWVNTILEYIGVANKLRALGMQAIEKKKNESSTTMLLNEKCLSSKKMFRAIKSKEKPSNPAASKIVGV